MITKILPNGHIVVIPEEDTKTWMKKYQDLCKNVNSVNSVNTEELEIEYKKKAEKEAIEVVAFRAFLRPSKEKFQRHVVPGVPWSTIKHCWSALGRSTPLKEFWNPVPGVVCGWKEKLKNMIAAYSTAGLLTTKEINIKIGVDGTNIWKINMETISLSFGTLENNLYMNPNAAHLVGIYIGKENRISLGKLNILIKIFIIIQRNQ